MTLKKGRLKEIVTELQGASKMHLKQSKEIAAHIDDMESPTKMVSPLEKGRCWNNYKPNPDGRPASEQGSCVPI
jgi:hypothetical protein|tara:strand:+ start:381 stop:602 length:222 start_codon:yes stop_codon:yes gene_type:complete